MNRELFEELSRLRNEMAHGGGPVEPSALASRLRSLGVSIPVEQLPELVPQFLRSFGGYAGHHRVPAVVRDVISRLLEDRPADTICDPSAGLGAVLAVAQQATSAQTAIALNMDASEAELGSALFPGADWRVGPPLRLLKELNVPLDVAVSVLPLGAKRRESLELVNTSGAAIELRDALGHLILAEAIAHLTEQGIGLFVVSPSLFFPERSVLRHFPELGFGVEAAFALPSGTLAPYTSVATYLVVVRRKPFERTFVAQLSNDEHTSAQILSNFRNGEEGGSVDLGRYVDILEFRGIDSLRAGEYIANASKRVGFPAVTLEELATTINLGRNGEDFKFPEEENAVFIPMIGQSDVVDSIEELTLKPQNYAQVPIDPSRSQAGFVARYLNSELGKKMREWGKSGTTIPKLNKQTLRQLQLFIPDLATQRRMLDVEARLATEENVLRSLQNELSELRRDLWRNPRTADTVSNRLGELSDRISGDLKEQASIGLEQWFETIPFPIASILRAWQATPSDDFKTKHEHLLHFFEATAEFLSVILLSAFSANQSLYEPHREKLIESLEKQRLSFERTTFGTWKLVVEYLGKRTRELLQESGKEPEDVKNDRAICATMFADETLRLPSLLSDKKIASVLAATNKMRNDWSGHGGVVGQDEARVRNEQLVGELERLREVMADVWESATVVNALHTRARRGSFENEIALLRGSNSEFLKESRSMSTWLDVDSLYIVNGGQGTALKMLPLVRVGASPQSAKNACYFFNRTEGDGARFVSYHFTDRPELSGQFEEAMEAIRFLTNV